MKTALAVVLSASLVAFSAHAEDLDGLLRRCAPQVHPTTLRAVMQVESGSHAYAISDDGPEGLPWQQRKLMLRSFYPGNKVEAIRIAEALLNDRHLVGVGPLQVGTRNAIRLGSSIAAAFEPCENIRLGGMVITEYYQDALAKYKNPQKALLAAISRYNTGSYERGFSNGYVRKVLNATTVRVPELKVGAVGGTTKIPPSSRQAGQAQTRVLTRSDSATEARMAKLEVESF